MKHYSFQFSIFSRLITPSLFKFATENLIRPFVFFNKIELYKTVSHYYVETKEEKKLETLNRLIKENNERFTVVFCEDSNRDIINKNWKKENIYHIVLNSSFEETIRLEIIKRVRSQRNVVFLVEDSLMRGLDFFVSAVVINYDFSPNIPTYFHRQRATGRFGRQGVVINIVTPFEIPKLNKIEEYFQITVSSKK